MRILLVLTTISLLFHASLAADILRAPVCNLDTLGDSVCEKFDLFEDYQYATCLTATYIEEQSFGFVKCDSKYCWYKCMTELFGTISGEVNSDCKCEPEPVGVITTTKSPNSKPPKKCYADNNDCSFYLDCLAYSAPNCTSFMNSLEYARVFCEVYNQNFTQFSLNGKSWLKAAENCFQVSMKPLMSASSSSSKKKCKEQKGNVKDKKAKCYLNPGKGKPSLCSLECTDWYRIFWTLKNESDVFTLAEDLSQFLRLFKGCKEISRCKDDFYVPTVSYKFNFKGKQLKKAKPQPNEDDDSDLDTVAASVAASLWSQLKLDPHKFDIFSFVEDPDKPTASNELDVLTWILSKQDFYSSSWQDSDALKRLEHDVTEAIKTGTIKLSVELNDETIGLSGANPCLNDLCTKTGPTIAYDLENGSSSIYHSYSAIWSSLLVLTPTILSTLFL